MDALTHFALDIETLSPQPNAIILSVGVTRFTVSDGILGSRAFNLAVEEQASAGRKLDGDTLQWWSSQTEEVRKLAFENATGASLASSFLQGSSPWETDERIRLPGRIPSYFWEPEAGVYWAGPSHFDFSQLDSYINTFHPGCGSPWSYKDVRCFSTIKREVLTDEQRENLVESVVPHSALHDSIALAHNVRAYLSGKS